MLANLACAVPAILLTALAVRWSGLFPGLLSYGRIARQAFAVLKDPSLDEDAKQARTAMLSKRIFSVSILILAKIVLIVGVFSATFIAANFPIAGGLAATSENFISWPVQLFSIAAFAALAKLSRAVQL